MPAIELDFHDKLTPANFERSLLACRLFTKNGWIDKLKRDGLIIDLRKIGWVEPSAAARVILLAEAVFLENCAVKVKLPRTSPTYEEQKIIESAERYGQKEEVIKAINIRNYVKRRKAALAQLKVLEFYEALKHEHLSNGKLNIEIIEEEDWSCERPKESKSQFPPIHDDETGDLTIRPPWYFASVYKLKWLGNPMSREGNNIIEELSQVDVLSKILSPGDGRVSAADGKTLAHVFLKELVENGIVHGKRDFCLVCAWARPAAVNLKDQEVMSSESEFAESVRGFPVLEVMVGDSGRGIINTLGRIHDTLNPSYPEVIRDWKREEKILWWSLDKWSTSAPRKEKRGTRGLYRVERIVRKYDGFLGLRSGNSFVGVDAGATRDYVREESRLARIPGTTVLARLPLRLAEKMPKIGKPLKKARFFPIKIAELKWADPLRTIEEVTDCVQDACKKQVQKGLPAHVIVDFGYQSIPQQNVSEERVLDLLIRRLAEVAHPVSIVVANIALPGWDACEQSINSLEEEIIQSQSITAEDRGSLHIPNAMLFIHADGNFAWAGITGDMKVILREATYSGILSVDRLKSACPDENKRNFVIRQVAEAYHVAYRPPEGGIKLYFNISDIMQYLEKNLNDELSQRVIKGSKGVLFDGLYRTPTLQIVNRYVNMEELLDDYTIKSLAWSLARKCKAIESLKARYSEIDIIVDSRAFWPLVDEFRRSLDTILQGSNVWIHQLGPADRPALRDGSAVLIFSDIILTENQIRRLYLNIVRAHGIAMAVISVFDARPLYNEPVNVLGVRIPVFAQVSINITPDSIPAEDEIINISPVDHKPEANEQAQSEVYPIRANQLADMLKQARALYFSHILRSNGRHFCFYLDAFSLMGVSGLDGTFLFSREGQLIIRNFRDAIQQWEGTNSVKAEIIWYPLSDRPSAAEKIGKELEKELGIPSRPIPRSGEAANWVFPEAITPVPASDGMLPFIEKTPARTAIVIDWGAMTGRSVNELIHLAIKAGALDILAIIFLNQLLPDEEQRLKAIRFMGFMQSGEIRKSKVEIKFLAKFPIRAFNALNCPHCMQIGRLVAEERRLFSSLLYEFIEKNAKQRLRPRSLEECRQERERYDQAKANEFQGSNFEIVDQQAMLTIGSFREYLEKSFHRTATRVLLFNELHPLLLNSDDENTSIVRERRGTLIRLLAAEWTWLKQEPLNLLGFRKVVAEISHLIALDITRPLAERRDAIVVLRTASKEHFASAFKDLFKLVYRDMDLVSQLLYCAFTYIDRDYLMPESLGSLLSPLRECVDFVKKNAAGTIKPAVLDCINALYLKSHVYYSRYSHTAPAEAWNGLAVDWIAESDIHHWPAKALFHLFFSYLEITDKNSLRSLEWNRLSEKWEEYGEQYIIGTIIPRTKALDETFQSLYSVGLITHQDMEVISAINSDEIIKRLNTLRVQLALFSNNSSLVIDSKEWSKFASARDWLWNVILDPGKILEGRRENGSTLIRVMKDCPCDLQKEISRIVQEINDTSTSGKPLLSISEGSNLKIDLEIIYSENPDKAFIRSTDLNDCILDLLHNASKWCRPKNGNKVVNVRIKLLENKERWHISVWNDGTAIPSMSPGRGLSIWRTAIKHAYKGDFISSVLPSNGQGAFNVDIWLLKVK